MFPRLLVTLLLINLTITPAIALRNQQEKPAKAAKVKAEEVDAEAEQRREIATSLVISLALGQDTAFILLGVLLWLWLLLEGKDFWAGLALSLAVVKPQIAVLLGIPLLFARPKAFAGFCVGGAALTLFSFLLVGVEGFSGLLNIVRVMSQGQGFGVNPQHMISVTGLLVRAGLSASWSWVFLALGLVVITVLWRKFGITRQTLSVAIVLALFCAPHLHLHDLSLLTAPIMFLHPLAPVAASAFLAAAYAFGFHQLAAFILFASVLIRVTYLRRNT